MRVDLLDLLVLVLLPGVAFAARHVVMLGDSTMRPVSQNLALLLSCKQFATTSNRCDQPHYYGMHITKRRWPPQDGEGPKTTGLERRGCMDCSSCFSAKHHCPVVDIELEYIGMEFSKDLELQTAQFETTQENIFLNYLAHRQVDAIVINAGMHDLATCSTAEVMRSSLRFLFEVIRKGFPTVDVIWLESNYIKMEAGIPQEYVALTNPTRMRMHTAVARNLTDEFGFRRLNLFNISTLPFALTRFRDAMHIALDNELFFKMVAFKLIDMVPALQVPDVRADYDAVQIDKGRGKKGSKGRY